MGVVKKLLERKLQKEKLKYMRLEHQRAKLAGMICVEKKNREINGKSDLDHNVDVL